MKSIGYIIFSVFLLSSRAYALEAPQTRLPDNAELTALYDADQGERRALFKLEKTKRKIAENKVWDKDLLRAASIKQMLRLGQIRTAADYWHAAFIMQHGANVEEIKLAFALATIATELEPETKKYKWITAAAWDRILTEQGQPQWYGTQFKSDPETGLEVQEKVAKGAVTDEERQLLGVPTLKESEDMLIQMNAGSKK